MSWKKEAYWYEWERPHKKGNRKKEDQGDTKTKGKKNVLLVGYDGKAVDVDSAGSSWQQSQPLSQETQALTENRRLKEAMRFMLDKVAPTDAEKAEIPDEVKELVRIDPRESIRLRQKELNEERKKINKIDKTKDSIDKKSKNFQVWKETVETGIRQEEKRHTSEMAELAQELKSLERQRDGIEPITVDTDDEEEPHRELVKENRQLHKEISSLKTDLQEVVAYTSQLDQKNARMMEQLQAQMMSLVGAIQGNVMTPHVPVACPEQNVKGRRKTLGTVLEKEKKEKDSLAKVKEEPGRGRSRTPDAERRVAKIPKVIQDYESQQLKDELLKYPEECQMAVLQTIQQDPEDYKTWDAVLGLIVTTHTQMLHACVGMGDGSTVPGAETAASVGPVELLPLQSHPVLQPFGKTSTRSRQLGDGPYTPPGLHHSSMALTPDGGRKSLMEGMS